VGISLVKTCKLIISTCRVLTLLREYWSNFQTSLLGFLKPLHSVDGVCLARDGIFRELIS